MSLRCDERHEAQEVFSWKWAFLIGVAVLVSYGPAWRAGFIWDDDDYVTANPTLKTLHGLKRIWCDIGATPQYYPLVHTTFWFEYHLWGLNPIGFHAVNILLHAANAVLVYALLLRMRIPGAAIAGLIFGIHPVEVESVAWVTERKNVLSGLFYLLAWHVIEPELIRASANSTEADNVSNRRHFAWKSYLAATILFACALLSKTVTASLPAAMILASYWRSGSVSRRTWLMTTPWLLMGAGMGALTGWMERWRVGAYGPEFEISLTNRVLIAGRSVWFYLSSVLMPVNLCFNYPRWQLDASSLTQWLYPVSAIALVIVLWCLQKRIGRGPLVIALFYGGTLFPALGFANVFPHRYSFFADHFQYLATLGPIILVSAIASSLFDCVGRWRPAVRALCVAVAGALSVMTFSQSMAYRDLETLWRHTIRVNPNSGLAHINLSVLLTNRGDHAEGEKHMHLALERAPELPEPYFSFGIWSARDGQIDKAESYYRKALKLRPHYQQANYNLGLLLDDQGRLAEAADVLEKALAVAPDYAEAAVSLSAVYVKQGRPEIALKILERILQRQPEHVGSLINLGVILASMQDYPSAQHVFRRAAVLDPKHPEATANLGRIALTVGRTDEGIRLLKKAIQLRSPWSDVERELAWAIAKAPNQNASDWQLVSRLVSRLIEAKEGSWRDVELLAIAETNLGHTDSASEILKQLLELVRKQGNIDDVHRIESYLRQLKGSP